MSLLGWAVGVVPSLVVAGMTPRVGRVLGAVVPSLVVAGMTPRVGRVLV
jgi:hypothetical protein